MRINRFAFAFISLSLTLSTLSLSVYSQPEASSPGASSSPATEHVQPTQHTQTTTQAARSGTGKNLPASASDTTIKPEVSENSEFSVSSVAPPSSAAQKLFSRAKNDLLQIRVLLKNGTTQASVGSGFLIGNSDLVLTNYHVMSQIALEPDVYTGEFIDTNGAHGKLELLAVDILHDLAVVRVNRKGTGFFRIPSQISGLATLTQGQYLYSLGNPLDLGFAISEGTYNGIIGRSFYDQYMFTGPINSGMSGGPNITADGSIAGVNVSKRLDGELVSFLVPAKFVVELLQQVAQLPLKANPQNKDFNADLARQLLAHQDLMVGQVLESPLSLKDLGPYRVPIRDSAQVRCWGRSNAKPLKAYTEDQINCQMESGMFISGSLQTGHIAIQHKYFQSKELDALRFAHVISNAFKNQIPAGYKNQHLSANTCHEQFLNNQHLPLRAVLCVSAYRKFSGLYDFNLIAASTDQALSHLQSRIEIRGVSYANGMRIARQFMASIALKGKSS